jgi:hypothetical protein
MATNIFPASPSELAAHPEVLTQLREAYESFRSEAESDPDVVAAFVQDPVNEFLKYAPAQFQASLSEQQKEAANAALLSAEPVGRVQAVLRTSPDGTKAELLSDTMMDASWGSAWCEIGLWTAIVVALGAAIAVSQGAAIAPLIALDAGILPVLAAITGLSEGAIAAMAAAGGFTFGKLIEAACA